MTNQEKILNMFSKTYFHDEFVFDALKFIPPNKTELEFSDLLVYFANYALLIQMKERNASEATGSNNSWFNSVTKKANKQHKDSLRYIKENSNITFINADKNEIILRDLPNHNIHHITILDNEELDYTYEKCYYSKALGVYNIFRNKDFETMCERLISPAEIINYLNFRIDLFKNNKPDYIFKDLEDESQMIPIIDEESVVAAYLWEAYEESLQTSEYCERFRYILHNYKNKIYGNYMGKYIQVINKLMMFDRLLIKAFIERVDKRISDANIDFFDINIIVPNMDIGIVFISDKQYEENKHAYYTDMVKYYFKLKSALGLFITRLANGEYDIIWRFIEHDWVQDEYLEGLKSNFESILPPSIINKFNANND